MSVNLYFLTAVVYFDINLRLCIVYHTTNTFFWDVKCLSFNNIEPPARESSRECFVRDILSLRLHSLLVIDKVTDVNSRLEP